MRLLLEVDFASSFISADIAFILLSILSSLCMDKHTLQQRAI